MRCNRLLSFTDLQSNARRRISREKSVHKKHLKINHSGMKYKQVLHFSSLPSGVQVPFSTKQLKQLVSSLLLFRISSRSMLSYLVVYCSSLRMRAASEKATATNSRHRTATAFILDCRLEANDAHYNPSTCFISLSDVTHDVYLHTEVSLPQKLVVKY